MVTVAFFVWAGFSGWNFYAVVSLNLVDLIRCVALTLRLCAAAIVRWTVRFVIWRGSLKAYNHSLIATRLTSISVRYA